MDILVRRLIAVVQIYGGVSGIVLAVRGVLAGRQSALEFFVALIFLALFVLGLTAGVRLLERNGGVRTSTWFQALQVPSILTPVVVYDFIAGVDFSLHLGQAVTLGYGFETHWRLALFPRWQEWGLSLNLFPLFAALYLRFLSRR